MIRNALRLSALVLVATAFNVQATPATEALNAQDNAGAKVNETAKTAKYCPPFMPRQFCPK